LDAVPINSKTQLITDWKLRIQVYLPL